MARPTRRPARVKVFIETGGRMLEGFTTNVSVEGTYVRVLREDLGDFQPKRGMHLSTTLYMPDPIGVVKSPARVVWTNELDIDIGGKKALGLGLSFTGADEEARRMREQFVDTFRIAVIVADSEPESVKFVSKTLGNDYEVVGCSTYDQVIEAVKKHDVGVVVAGRRVGDISGLQLIGRVSNSLPYSNVVGVLMCEDLDGERPGEITPTKKVFTFDMSPTPENHLRETVKNAVDFYLMHAEVQRINTELERRIRDLEVEKKRLRGEVSYLQRYLEKVVAIDNFIGESPAIRKVMQVYDRVKDHDAPVLILGESGTGKEILARAIIENGPRSDKTFITVNCANLPKGLEESELFGYKKGAFTGAVSDRTGHFKEADGGTLFLDEIGDLPISAQAKVLRAIENKEITPLGTSKKVKVDVRLVAASNKDLKKGAEEGWFRKDLYYRIAGVVLELPPLREREGDVPLLASHFLELSCARYSKKIPGFTPEVMEAFERYSWPGNVRELENEVGKIVMMADDSKPLALDLVSPAVLRRKKSEAGTSKTAPSIDSFVDVFPEIVMENGRGLDKIIKEMEGNVLRRAIDICDGNCTLAAKKVGLPRGTFRSRLAKHSKK